MGKGYKILTKHKVLIKFRARSGGERGDILAKPEEGETRSRSQYSTLDLETVERRKTHSAVTNPSRSARTLRSMVNPSRSMWALRKMVAAGLS